MMTTKGVGRMKKPHPWRKPVRRGLSRIDCPLSPCQTGRSPGETCLHGTKLFHPGNCESPLSEGRTPPGPPPLVPGPFFPFAQGLKSYWQHSFPLRCPSFWRGSHHPHRSSFSLFWVGRATPMISSPQVSPQDLAYQVPCEGRMRLTQEQLSRSPCEEKPAHNKS